MAERAGLYASIMERIFFSRYAEGIDQIDFERSDIIRAAEELGLARPSNVGDLLYSFRYRASLPDAIQKTAKEGESWIIRPAGRAKYRFVRIAEIRIIPNNLVIPTKVPDATPGMVARYALSDEQALLARVRYNRLIDIFSGVTCYSLQSHLRTTVPRIRQVETDEIYIGIDKRGAHYVFPIQAKGGKDRLSVVQIEQDIEVCRYKFPVLICRAVAAQFMANDVIALFELAEHGGSVGIVMEKHYRLVAPDEISQEELESYQRLSE